MDKMNDTGSKIGQKTLGHELRALIGKNDSRSRWKMTLGRELYALNRKE